MATLKACDVIKNRVKDVFDYEVRVVRKAVAESPTSLGKPEQVLRDVDLCMCPQAEARLLTLLDRGTKAPSK